MNGIKLSKTKKYKFSYIIIMCLFSLFFVTKMLRSFSGTEVQGGIWNYIQLLFVLLGVICVLFDFKFVCANRVGFALLFFTIEAIVNSVIFVSWGSRTELFGFLTLPYALSVFAIAMVMRRKNYVDFDLILVATYYIITLIFLVSMMSTTTYSTSTGSVSDVYYSMMLLPLVLRYQKRLQFIPIILCGFAILVSGKRTGLIAFVLIVILFYFYRAVESKQLMKFVGYLLLFSVIAVVFLFAFEWINETFNTRLFLRMTSIFEDGGSGRASRWKKIYTALKDSSFTEIVLGHGFRATSKTFNNAHNDFLQIFYDYGLISVLMYIGFYVSTFAVCVRMFRSKYRYSIIFLMTLVCSVFMAMFSFYIIDVTYITAGMLCTGTIYADYSMYKRTVINYQ